MAAGNLLTGSVKRMSLHTNLKKLRKYYGYTQKQLAGYLEVTRQAYAYYETGERTPNYVVLTKVAEFYGITVESLVTPKEELPGERERKTKSPYEYLPEQERYLLELIKELPMEEREDLLLYLKRKADRAKEREGRHGGRDKMERKGREPFKDGRCKGSLSCLCKGDLSD
jgi:transcriptional regulator with XRE-family HTH domain